MYRRWCKKVNTLAITSRTEMDFSQGLQRPINITYGCGHLEHYESIGKCVEGELIYCDYCGATFFDKDNPKVYTDRENAEWYYLYRIALKAVREGRACFWDDIRGHRACAICEQEREQIQIIEENARNKSIRASVQRPQGA